MEDAVQYVYDYLEDNIPDYEWEFPEDGFLHLNLALPIMFFMRFPWLKTSKSHQQSKISWMQQLNKQLEGRKSSRFQSL